MRRLLIRLSDDQIWLDGVTNEWLSTSNMIAGNCNCIPTRKIFSPNIITITDISILVFPGSQTEKAEKPFPHLNPNDKMTAAPDVLPSPWASLFKVSHNFTSELLTSIQLLVSLLLPDQSFNQSMEQIEALKYHFPFNYAESDDFKRIPDD